MLSRKYSINIFVTLSNIIGVIGLWYCSGLKQYILGFSVITSILMHLSEQKHGLPGIYPFNHCSTIFLWFDRVGAWIAGLYAILYITNVTLVIMILIVCSALTGFISEIIITNQQKYYLIFHSIWHILVYSIFLLMTTDNYFHPL